MQLRHGSGTDRLAPLSQANRDADGRAFAALMRRVREVDRHLHTVIRMQVENEVGVIPDYSARANDAYGQEVPRELMDYLQKRKGHGPLLSACEVGCRGIQDLGKLGG